MIATHLRTAPCSRTWLPQFLPDDTRALILSVAPTDRPFTSALIRRHYPDVPVSTIGNALHRMTMDGQATRERLGGQWRYLLRVPVGGNTGRV